MLRRTDTPGVLRIFWSVLHDFVMTNCALSGDQCRLMVVGTVAAKLPRPDVGRGTQGRHSFFVTIFCHQMFHLFRGARHANE